MPNDLTITRGPLWAEDLRLDKVDHGGVWRLTYAPENAPIVLRLSIEVLSPGDTFHFQAEVGRPGTMPVTVGEFFIDLCALTP